MALPLYANLVVDAFLVCGLKIRVLKGHFVVNAPEVALRRCEVTVILCRAYHSEVNPHEIYGQALELIRAKDNFLI